MGLYQGEDATKMTTVMATAANRSGAEVLHASRIKQWSNICIKSGIHRRSSCLRGGNKKKSQPIWLGDEELSKPSLLMLNNTSQIRWSQNGPLSMENRGAILKEYQTDRKRDWWDMFQSRRQMAVQVQTTSKTLNSSGFCVVFRILLYWLISVDYLDHQNHQIKCPYTDFLGCANGIRSGQLGLTTTERDEWPQFKQWNFSQSQMRKSQWNTASCFFGVSSQPPTPPPTCVIS